MSDNDVMQELDLAIRRFVYHHNAMENYVITFEEYHTTSISSRVRWIK